jgi:Sensors of blue-light using FAD
MPLTRLIYFSRCTWSSNAASRGIDDILATARAHNGRHAVTSALVTTPEFFLQAIEGRRSVVSALYARIVRDSRHRDIEVLVAGPVDERLFPRWPMLLVDLAGTPPADVRRFTAGPDFDPERMSPGMALGFLQVTSALAVAGYPLTEDPDVIPFPR